MRLVSVDHVKPHTFLAKTIYDDQGRVLLAKGTQLNEHYIRRLGDLGIWSLYIQDDLAASIEIDDVVSERTRVQVIQTTKEALQKAQAGRSIDSRKIREAVGGIIDEILQTPDIIVHITDVRSLQDHTFGHSVNVCILSMITGMAMGYDQLKLKELGTGALLHDVGKAMIPQHIINSPKVLSAEEYRLVQNHSSLGFEALRKSENISAVVADVAFQHHERFNGKGYPRNLAGKDIMEFARVVAIADVYDALTTDRPYRKRLLPHEVVEIIRDSYDDDFDGEIVVEFIRNIAPYPKGSIVLLNSGHKGIVVDVRKESPTRPKIQLLYDNKGAKVPGNPIVDLLSHLTVFVQDVLRE